MKHQLVVLGICLFITATASAGTVIDDFTVGEYSLGRDATALPFDDAITLIDPTGDHIVGGQRAVEFHVTSSDWLGQPNVNCHPNYAVCSYNSFFGTDALWVMRYGGAGMDVDLTPGSADAILFAIEGDMDDSNPQRTLPLTVTVTGGGTTASVTQTDGSDGLHVFPFAAFAGVDFAHVTEIVISIVADQTQNDAMDFALYEILAENQSGVANEDATWGELKMLYR